jgi:hypothetical protein
MGDEGETDPLLAPVMRMTGFDMMYSEKTSKIIRSPNASNRSVRAARWSGVESYHLMCLAMVHHDVQLLWY